MLFVTEEYTLVLTTRFVHFKHGMTRFVKELFYSSVHDKSVTCIPTVCNNWLRIKLVTNRSNRE